jgi:PqqA peptide cyclase
MREIDFGGCRCQAALLTGDANATDPACELSPYREKLTRFVESIQTGPETIPALAADLGRLSFRQTPIQTGMRK